MSKYKSVCRCKSCGKIYAHGIPYICEKCGTDIGTPSNIFFQALGLGEVALTNNCEYVTAKRTLFGWKLKEKGE